jgi:hypothetical protein
VSGTAILFVGGIKPVISIRLACPPRNFATEPDIARFKKAERITTEAEALRRVVQAGIRSLRSTGKNDRP